MANDLPKQSQAERLTEKFAAALLRLLPEDGRVRRLVANTGVDYVCTKLIHAMELSRSFVGAGERAFQRVPPYKDNMSAVEIKAAADVFDQMFAYWEKGLVLDQDMSLQTEAMLRYFQGWKPQIELLEDDGTAGDAFSETLEAKRAVEETVRLGLAVRSTLQELSFWSTETHRQATLAKHL